MGAESKLSAEAAARFVLGLSQGCSKEEVKRAFKRLALVFHPDKNKGQNEEEATRRFQAIATAKDLLLKTSGVTGAVAKEMGRPRATAAPTPKKPVYVATWTCGACQMRHLGSSPGSARTSEVACARASSSTLCFCGHRFGAHEVVEGGSGSVKFRSVVVESSVESSLTRLTRFVTPKTMEPGGFHGEMELPERRWNLLKVCIRHSGGKNLHLEVSASETVKLLKRQLEECLGILTKDQRLLCRGALMVDERTLGSYDLEDAVIVFAPQLRLRQDPHTAWPKCRGPGKEASCTAARGFLMVPGAEKW
eukprot:symbB.v1.2.024554.t1/scaffold2333.1/size82048/1